MDGERRAAWAPPSRKEEGWPPLGLGVPRALVLRPQCLVLGDTSFSRARVLGHSEGGVGTRARWAQPSAHLQPGGSAQGHPVPGSAARTLQALEGFLCIYLQRSPGVPGHTHGSSGNLPFSRPGGQSLGVLCLKHLRGPYVNLEGLSTSRGPTTALQDLGLLCTLRRGLTVVLGLGFVPCVLTGI